MMVAALPADVDCMVLGVATFPLKMILARIVWVVPAVKFNVLFVLLIVKILNVLDPSIVKLELALDVKL